MSTQFPSNNPTGYFGISATNPGQNWFRQHDPLSSEYRNYTIGDRWINLANNRVWTLTGRTATAGTWTESLNITDVNTKLGVQTANTVILGEGVGSPLGATAVGSAGQVLQSSGAGVDPAWTTATYPTSTTGGEVLLSSANDVVVSSPNIVSDSVGRISMPSQSGASAYLAASIPNATGDLTQVAIAFDTVDYDIQGEYDLTTGEFTVSEAGIYLVTTNVLLGAIGAAHNIGNLQIMKNADIWWQSQYNPSATAEAASQVSVNGSVVIQCASADILKVLVQVGGGAKTVTISSAAGAHTTLQISKIA